MRITLTHPFDLSPSEAREVQRLLRAQVEEGPPLRPERVRLALGTDVSYLRADRLALAAAVCCNVPALSAVEQRVSQGPLVFPYVPGLLSFRELPALIPALRALNCEPDVIVVDGQGVAHPYGIGLASHLGLMTGRPTIGCAKSVLVGEHTEPGPVRGDWTPLMYLGRRVGAALRTRTGVKPVFVSVGHRIDLESAIEIILALTRRYRLPEPQRLAHLACEQLKRAHSPKGSGTFGEF